MRYRRLGKAGVQVSELSFGSWLTFGKQVDNKVAENCMKEAYDAGVNFFDNAEVYAHGKSEIVMGKILKKMGWGRDSYLVSSKVYWGGDLPNQKGLSRKHVVEACEAALKRLQVDYLDLYFCHRPDQNTPVEETVWTMHNLIQQGKILYWGTSEWSAQQITEAFMVARQYNLIPPTMEQPQYNMFHRERFEVEYRRLYTEFGYGTTIWSPLASGLLTGKYNEKSPKNTRLSMEGMGWLKDRTFGDNKSFQTKIRKIEKLGKIAGDLGTTMPGLALAWCLYNEHVSTVITGASKVSQVKDNMNAVDVVDKITPEVYNAIENILKNKPEQPPF